MFEGWDGDPEDEKEYTIERLQAKTAWSERRSIVERRAAEDDSAAQINARIAEAIGGIGLRYFGGLPGHPSETDVSLDLGRELLRVIGSSGTILGVIPIASIVAAVEFDAETSLGW
jgi:hypothetical protein